MQWCEYKDLLGTPGMGAHSYRVDFPGIPQGLAVVDVIITILLAVALSRGKFSRFLFSLVFLIIVAEFAHRAFCVRTALDKHLFPPGAYESFIG
jgi:hypothetical protein